MDAAFGVLRATFVGLAGVFSVGAITNAFTSAVKDLAALDDAAEKTGASVESIGRLLGTAAESGAGLVGLTALMTQLSRAVVGTEQETAKAARAFKALSIDPKSFSDTGDLLLAVAKGLDQFADGAEKSQLAITLLGRAGAEQLPLLKDLASAQTSGSRVTAEMAAEAEKLEKAMNRLTYEASLAKVEFLSGIIPAINELIVKFREAKQFADGFFDRINLTGRSKANLQTDRDAIITRIQENALNRAKAQAGELKFFDKLFSSKEAVIDSLDERLRKDTAELARINAFLQAGQDKLDTEKARRENDFPGRRPTAPRVEDPSKGSGRDINEQLRDEINNLTARALALDKNLEAEAELFRLDTKFAGANPALLEQARAFIRRSVEVKKALEVEKDRAKVLEDYARDNARFQAEEINALARIEEIENRSKESALAGLSGEKERNELAKEFLGLLSKTSGEEAKRLQKMFDYISVLQENGQITIAQANEIKEKLAGVNGELDKQKTLAQEIGAAFESALSNTILQTQDAAKAFDNLGKVIANAFVKKLVVDPLLKQVRELASKMAKTFEESFKEAASLGGFLSKLFGFGGGSKGGYDNPLGGDVAPYMSGNAGAVLESYTPSGVAATGAKSASGITVNNYNNIGEGVSRAEVYSAMEITRNQTLKAISDQQRGRS